MPALIEREDGSVRAVFAGLSAATDGAETFRGPWRSDYGQADADLYRAALASLVMNQFRRRADIRRTPEDYTKQMQEDDAEYERARDMITATFRGNRPEVLTELLAACGNVRRYRIRYNPYHPDQGYFALVYDQGDTHPAGCIQERVKSYESGLRRLAKWIVGGQRLKLQAIHDPYVRRRVEQLTRAKANRAERLAAEQRAKSATEQAERERQEAACQRPECRRKLGW